MNDELKIVAARTVRFSCGTVETVQVHRERGSFYLWTPGYQTRYATKREAVAALAAYPEAP